MSIDIVGTAQTNAESDIERIENYKDVVDYFKCHFPDTKPMPHFGTFALYIEGKPVLSLYSGNVYVKLSASQLKSIPATKRVQLVQKLTSTGKRSAARNLGYFKMDVDYTSPIMLKIITDALAAWPVKDNVSSLSRLNRMPNLRVAHERMLKAIGVLTPCDLKSMGTEAVITKIYQMKGQNTLTAYNLALNIEGAITNTHWSIVPDHRKRELRALTDRIMRA